MQYLARHAQNRVCFADLEVWKHSPHCPDLAPCDFPVFDKLKENLGGRQFSNHDQVNSAFLSWLQEHGGIFYRQGIKRLVQRSMSAATGRLCREIV
ncbi:hypothetical protein AVEN_2503-1 [Araneus ventricosus]|uniref:Histone-lysine N-methyltransferase SETMAR n=1 Tax=Araneus ventricosus TaxID=182803 RepID=A0A4Y2GC32_ARAVE|nr:hypothetical protein AVEN_2503-1 [Araneus ventricosus]